MSGSTNSNSTEDSYGDVWDYLCSQLGNNDTKIPPGSDPEAFNRMLAEMCESKNFSALYDYHAVSMRRFHKFDRPHLANSLLLKTIFCYLRLFSGI